jgi:D-amino-acid oxidase
VRLYTAKGAPEGMGPIVSGPTSVGQFVPEFRELKSGDGAWNAVDAVAGARDEGAALVGGTAFRTLCTDMHAYLAHLRQRLTAGGATLETIRIDSIADLSDRYPDAACLINCAGYGNRELVGDETMIPVRGQTVLVRAPEQRSFFSLVTGDKRHPVHVIPQGNGTCIVGGAKYAGDTREEPEAELAERLLRQAVAWCPALRDARENVLSHRVAFRPFRKDGVRLEVDPASGQLPGVLSPVVHNYGHGDVGVILAWGCAEDARELVRGAIADHVARKRQRRS